MKRFIPFLILIIFLTIAFGCGNNKNKIIELSPIDSLGWDENEYTFAGASAIIKVKDYLVTTDLSLSEVALFNCNDLSHVKTISTRGNGPKESFFPYGLAVMGDNIIVNDLANNRIKEIDLEGNLINNYPGIRAFYLGSNNEKLIFAPTDRTMDTAILQEIIDGDIKDYALTNLFLEKYVKMENGKIPFYRFFMADDCYLFQFSDEESRRTLCVSLDTGEIKPWDSIADSPLDAIMNIAYYDNFFYFLVIRSKDFYEQEPGDIPRLLKINRDGKVVKTALITSGYTGTECFNVIDNRMFMYDGGSGSIKVYDLQGF